MGPWSGSQVGFSGRQTLRQSWVDFLRFSVFFREYTWRQHWWKGVVMGKEAGEVVMQSAPEIFGQVFLWLIQTKKGQLPLWWWWVFWVFFSFSGQTCSMWKFPGWGSNWSYRSRLGPEPQQRQLQAASVTYATACSNSGSFTYRVRPGIEPASSQTQYPILNPLSQNGNCGIVTFTSLV